MAPPEEKDAVAIEAAGEKDKDKDAKAEKEKKKEEEDELSPEDKALQEGLELAVERLKDPDHNDATVTVVCHFLAPNECYRKTCDPRAPRRMAR